MVGKKNLASPPYLNNLPKLIGNTGLNSGKCYLAFQSILYDEDFSEYVTKSWKAIIIWQKTF